jgi:ribonuclease III
VPLFGAEKLPPERKRVLAAFQRAAGTRFKDLSLLDTALTHRSSQAGARRKGERNNERLEFLGDSILGASVASWLYEELKDRSEGELARIKSFVVSEACLSGLALSLGIDACLSMGKGEELSGGRKKKAILADALEAVIGAFYRETDFPTAKKFVLKLIVPEIQKVLSHRHKKDYKTIIQEFFQRETKSAPRYLLEGKSGPDHERVFTMRLSVNGREFPGASGKSKKEAEQNAARAAYEEIIGRGGAEAETLARFELSSI